MKRLPTPPTLLLCSLALLFTACASPDAPSDAADATTPAAEPLPQNVPLAPLAGGDTAPDFVVPTLAGDSLRLSDLRGRVVVLNFWATWCAPCIAEIPELVALHEALSPHGLSVVGVSTDVEGAAAVGPFTDGFDIDITYPIPIDPDGDVSALFGGIWSLPTTYIIDQEGRIVRRQIGLLPVDDLRPYFREMLGLPPQ